MQALRVWGSLCALPHLVHALCPLYPAVDQWQVAPRCQDARLSLSRASVTYCKIQLWVDSLTARNGDDLRETHGDLIWRCTLGKSTLTCSSILPENTAVSHCGILCQHLESHLPWDGQAQGCFLVWLTEVPANFSHHNTSHCVSDGFLFETKISEGIELEQRGKVVRQELSSGEEKRSWVWEKERQRPKETLQIQCHINGRGQAATSEAGQPETSSLTLKPLPKQW